MARKKGGVTWYGDEILAEFDERAGISLHAIGLQIVGEAQRNITDNSQVDTGFMRLSGYVHSANGQSTYNETRSSGQLLNRGGSMVERDRAPERSPESDLETIVAFAAAYALFQELRNPFLYPAVESVARQVDDIMQDAFDD